MKKHLKKFIFLAIFLCFSIIRLEKNFASPANQWVQVGTDWYYVGLAGNFLTSAWVEYNGNLYHLNEEGKMDKNKWIDNTYYVDNEGKMLRNTTTPDGYLVDSTGKYVSSNIITPTSGVIYAPTDERYVAKETAGVIYDPETPTAQNTSSGSSKDGYHVKYNNPTIESDYYNDNKYKTYIKVIRPEISFDGWFSTSRKEKMDNLNDIIDNMMDDHFEKAESLAERSNIKRYVIDKCKIARVKYGELVLFFEGNMRDKNNSNTSLNFYLHYDIYDGKYYVSSSIS